MRLTIVLYKLSAKTLRHSKDWVFGRAGVGGAFLKFLP